MKGGIYMKKIFCTFLFFLFAISFVFAQAGIGGSDIVKSEEGNGSNVDSIQTKTLVQTKVQSGNDSLGDENQVQIQAQRNNRLQLKVGNVSIQSSMEMNQEGEKLQVRLSNGENAEVKVMPEVASDTALEKLRLKACSSENNCSIELKEVGKGDQVRAAYEIQAQKQSKVLGLFKAKMQVQVQVDSETGELIQSKKPWWAFLASESEE